MSDLLHESEREDYAYYLDDVDFDYIELTADALAEVLKTSRPAGACFQPGDGTAYRLVFTPLWTMGEAPGRLVHGQRWSGRSVEGMGDFYGFGQVLISLVGRVAYPLELVRSTKTISSDYVGEHWDLPTGSAITVALLLRALAQRFFPA